MKTSALILLLAVGFLKIFKSQCAFTGSGERCDDEDECNEDYGEDVSIDKDVVLLTGGYGGTSPEATVSSADVFGRSDCSPAFNLPDQRIGHSSHLVDGQVLICGSSGRWSSASSSCLQLLDGSFSTHSQLNSPRYMHVGLILAGKLTLIGSSAGPGGSEGAAESLETLTGTTWTECRSQICRLGPGTSVGASCAVVQDGKRALVIGGGEAGDQVLMYEVGAGWTEVSSLPGKRFYHSCAILANGDVLVAGGYDNDRSPMSPPRKVLDTAIIYQLDQTLELPGRMKTGRAGGKMVNLGGRILYFGGKRTEVDQEGLDTVEEFHQDTGTWTLLKETMDSPRQHFSAVVVPGSAVGC